jgi:hypothetical protein
LKKVLKEELVQEMFDRNKNENSLGTAGTAHSANAFLVGQTVGGSGTGGWWIATSNFSVSD